MHSLLCAEVSQILRQVSVSDVPCPNKVWAAEVYETAVTRLKSVNSLGLRLAETIDTYAEAWNAFVQHGDDHGLRQPAFRATIEKLVDANDGIITATRKELKQSIKENGRIITRHSDVPGKECPLKCARIVPESKETRQIREQVLGWTMKDYCYHHPLKTLLQTLTLRWKQLEYATSILKILLLAQIHAEHVHTGQFLDVKVERSKQLEAIRHLKLKQQQLYNKEADEKDQSLLYGNPIGAITVNDLHQLPLLITVTSWFKAQNAAAKAIESPAENSEPALEAQLRRKIQDATSMSLDRAQQVMNQLNQLRAQHIDLMRKTDDIVRHLRCTQTTGATRTLESGSRSVIDLADIVYHYVVPQHSPVQPLSRRTSHELANSEVKDLTELDNACKQEIGGSGHHYPIEKSSETPSHSRRSSIWGLEDACTMQETFDLAALERFRGQSTNEYADSDDRKLNLKQTDTGRSFESLTSTKSTTKGGRFGENEYPSDNPEVTNTCVNRLVYELADAHMEQQFPGIYASKLELPPIASISGDYSWVSEIPVARTVPD